MSIGIERIRKSFGSFVALQDINLQLPSGELTALLGPSGSGKTTLLRIIAGLEQADSGLIRCNDDDLSQRPVAEHHAHPLADVPGRGGVACRRQVVEQPWQRHGQGDLQDGNGRHCVQCIGPSRRGHISRSCGDVLSKS